MTSAYNPRKLLREPGVPDHVAFETTARDAVADSRIDSDRPIRAELTLVAGDRGIEVSGRLTGSYTGVCRRCLAAVSGDLAVDVSERFSPDPSGGDAFVIADDRLDLAEMARELMLLALPLSPLCEESCAGPDPEHFPVSVEGTDDVETPRDPRWAALDVVAESLRREQ